MLTKRDVKSFEYPTHRIAVPREMLTKRDVKILYSLNVTKRVSVRC